MRTTRPSTAVLSLCAAALTLWAAGCAVDESKEVAKYRRVLDGKNAAPVRYAAGEPLSLEGALLLANRHNEQLAIEGENYLQALIDKDRAAASFWPTVTLAPNYSIADEGEDRSRQFGGGGGGTDTDGDGVPDDDTSVSGTASGDGRFDLPVNARYNAFNGFRDVANLRRAGADINRRRALLRDLQATVLLDVARTYYQVLRSQRSVRVLENSVSLQDARVRDMRGRQQAGIARPLDVAQTEAQASATRVSLVAARSDVRNGRTVLAFLTGAPVAEAPREDALDVPPDLPGIERALEDAATSRQDLRAARAGVEAAGRNVQGAVGQYYPSVTLNLNYFLSRQSFPTESDWNGIIQANLPLFTGGLIHANVRTALSRLRQAKQEESLLQRQVEQDVRVAYENLAASRQRLDELRVQLRAADQALRQAEASYRAGLATNLERLTAQDQQLSAQLQLASEEFDQKVFYLNLLRVLGNLRTPLPLPPGPAPAPPPASAPVGRDSARVPVPGIPAAG